MDLIDYSNINKHSVQHQKHDCIKIFFLVEKNENNVVLRK